MNFYRLYIISMSLLFIGVGVSIPAEVAAEQVVQIAKNSSYSCRREHNAGAYAGDYTFVCWAGPLMMPYVKMYDHASKAWSKSVMIDPRPLEKRTKADYHYYPVLVVGGDKHLYVFREGDYYRSPRPLDVRGEWSHGQPAARTRTGVRYPAPLVHTTGNIYVFYRFGASHGSTGGYAKSSDNGQNWEVHQNAIAGQLWGRPHGFYLMHTVYEPAQNDKPERLHLTWFLRKKRHENVYFVYFLPGPDRFESVDGSNLGQRITEREREAHCVVETVSSAHWQILSHFTEEGNPVVVCDSKSDKIICAAWNGDEWKSYPTPFARFTTQGWQPGPRAKDIEKIGAKAFRIYCKDPRQPHHIVWYETQDSGKTWAKSGQLQLPVPDFLQATVLDNNPAQIRLLIKQNNPRVHRKMRYMGTNRILVLESPGELPQSSAAER